MTDAQAAWFLFPWIVLWAWLLLWMAPDAWHGLRRWARRFRDPWA